MEEIDIPEGEENFIKANCNQYPQILCPLNQSDIKREIKYSVERSRGKVKELIQKVESKCIEMKNNREKIKLKYQSNILLISVMDREKKQRREEQIISINKFFNS